MIATAFVYIVLFAGMAVLFGLVGAFGTYALQGEAVTRSFLKSYFVTFNAIGVAAFGYALMLFLRNTGKSMIGQLSTMLEIPDEHADGFLRAVDRATSTRWANVIAIPLTIIGSIALWWRGFPLDGFAKLYLAACSFSIYYVASNILSFFIYVILLFRYVEERSVARGPDRFRLKCAPASMEIQTIDTFLIVSSTISVITLYIGVRATLTANFSDDVAVISELLLLPFILYLPATLCYSFYPRYVLRQISENETRAALSEKLEKDKLDRRSLEQAMPPLIDRLNRAVQRSLFRQMLQWRSRHFRDVVAELNRMPDASFANAMIFATLRTRDIPLYAKQLVQARASTLLRTLVAGAARIT